MRRVGRVARVRVSAAEAQPIPVARPAPPRALAPGERQTLMHALCLFALAPTGFRHREFREHVAQLQGRDADTYSAGAMTHDLRRLRLHGLIERIPHSHRYGITPAGAQIAMFYARLSIRALRPACSLQPRDPSRAQRAFERFDNALASFLEEVKFAA